MKGLHTMDQDSANPQIEISPERINDLAHTVLVKLNSSIKEINDINLQTRVLSFNSQIQAARVGEAGRSFSVVGREMVNLAARTSSAAENLNREAQGPILELAEISRQLSTSVRGTRLSDLALVNISLIDRNLYERTCDVRWWATDSSVVDALTDPTPEACRYASKRLGVILQSYTVYFDLVLADLEGNIIANGRPDQYRSEGTNVSQSAWFRTALATRSGEEYGFETVTNSPLVNNQNILTYSCTVRRNGEARGEVLGVLGILFNWDSLAQTIMYETPLSPDEKNGARVCIIDDAGNVLADSQNRILQQRLALPDMAALLQESKNYVLTDYNQVPCVVAHAQAPGYETYSTGWHSVIIESLASGSLN